MEPYDSYAPRLSEGERYVVLAWGFVAETMNGGLHQFLTNSTGDYAQETREALHAIGAILAVEALDAARLVLFGGNPIPRDPLAREHILSEWDKVHGEDAAYEFLGRYDGQLDHCESVNEAIAGYIREHYEMFG